MAAKTQGYICVAVIICEQDSALKWLCFRLIICGINEGLALNAHYYPFQHCFMVYIIERLMIFLLLQARTYFRHFEGMLTNYALAPVADLR